jgi:RNA polymerase sigma factor (sigma-70 family)
MEKQFFQYFIEQTKGFLFAAEGGLPTGQETDGHDSRVRKLVGQVRKMAIAYHFRTPGAVAREMDRDDWVQQAMITMFECCQSYDRQRPFDHYVRFMVKRRLEDQRRMLYRKNPKAWQGETSQSGSDERLFCELGETVERKTHSSTSREPEQKSLMNEAHRLLLECIQRLKETERMLFTKHEMEEVSFRDLYQSIPEFGKSFATFKRWYLAEVFDRVKECVHSRLPA